MFGVRDGLVRKCLSNFLRLLFHFQQAWDGELREAQQCKALRVWRFPKQACIANSESATMRSVAKLKPCVSKFAFPQLVDEFVL